MDRDALNAEFYRVLRQVGVDNSRDEQLLCILMKQCQDDAWEQAAALIESIAAGATSTVEAKCPGGSQDILDILFAMAKQIRRLRHF